MYKICAIKDNMIPVPMQVTPMRLYEALDYIEEYQGELSLKDIVIFKCLDKSFEPLVPIRETRFDVIFEHANWSNLLTDMTMYWDEYWDDWEYYDMTHKIYADILLKEKDLLNV